jgi:ionotropic glutamate receptor
VIWPGGGTAVPRGWVVPKNGRPLTIGVPNKVGYQEFVGISTDSNNQTTYTGYCIDVFEKALALLPYAVSYNFVTFGNGSITPNYDDLVEQVAEKVPTLLSNHVIHIIIKINSSALTVK